VTLDTAGIRWFPTLRGGQAYGEDVGPPSPAQLSLGQRDGVVNSVRPLTHAASRVPRGSSASPTILSVDSDDRLEALLDAAPDAMVCIEESGRIAMLNHQVTSLFGYDRGELLGAEVEMLLPEAARAQHARHRREFSRHPQMRSMGTGLSLVARRRDGSEFPVEVSLAPYLAGGPGWVVAAIRDVSAQRALEAASRESEARLRQIAESVDLVFLLLQLEPPVYLYVSSGAQRLIGIDSQASADIIESQRMSRVHPDDQDAVERDFQADARAGRPADSEYRLVTDDGEVVWVRALATPVLNPHGPPERTVITLEDITRRILATEALQRAEASARAANDSKNLFLSRMSHELRTPLNAVLGFGQLLSRQLAGTEHAEAVDYVLKGGRHLLDLINDVLDVARIESGEMSLSLETVTLATLVEETLQLMGPLAVAAEVTFEPVTGDPGVRVLADRQRVRQILLNLLSNAIKYNREGGRVWVSWVLYDDAVRLTIRDDGRGIAPELQDRLFRPFDRLGAEGTPVEGAGIGLALTRSLAELMAGSVTVESTANEGASFSVSLPVDPVTGEEEPESGRPTIRSGAAAGPQPTPTRMATLLYIEDNEPNVHVVEHLLELRPGWRMIHAALGGLGVEIARAHRPDLIFLDLHLPDLPGRDVLLSLKRRDDTRDIPVVILSADASTALPRQLVEAGAELFLTKPLDLEVVLGLLDDVRRDRIDVERRAPGPDRRRAWDRRDGTSQR
jgi:PAS domain S-box-containing protein